jgi:hypothetical protein
MHNLVADANNVRWTNDALRSGPGFSIPRSDEKNHVLGFLRWNYGGNVILTVVNLSGNQWDDPIYGVVGAALEISGPKSSTPQRLSTADG